MSDTLSDPTPIVRLTDKTMQPVDPHALVHFLAACQVAGVSATGLGPTDLRALIQRLTKLSIPDAVKLLRRETSCK